ncbi:MAG: hypothetical protein ACLR2E_09095 [Lachnospiraceae bacterium]
MIRSFRYSRSDLLSDDLTYANFTVTLLMSTPSNPCFTSTERISRLTMSSTL